MLNFLNVFIRKQPKLIKQSDSTRAKLFTVSVSLLFMPQFFVKKVFLPCFLGSSLRIVPLPYFNFMCARKTMTGFRDIFKLS